MASKPTPSICNDYPLRPDYLAQLVVPRDMTEAEARRLCEFIMSLAQPTLETAPEYVMKPSEEAVFAKVLRAKAIDNGVLCICKPVGCGDGNTYAINPNCQAHGGTYSSENRSAD